MKKLFAKIPAQQNRSVLILALPGAYTNDSRHLIAEFGVLLYIVDEGKWQLGVIKFLFSMNCAPSCFLHV